MAASRVVMALLHLPVEVADTYDDHEQRGQHALHRSGGQRRAQDSGGNDVLHLQAAGHLAHGKGGDGQAGDAGEQVPWDARLGEQDLGKGQQHEDHHGHLDAAVHQQGAYQYVDQQRPLGSGLVDEGAADAPGGAALVIQRAQQGAQGEDHQPAAHEVLHADEEGAVRPHQGGRHVQPAEQGHDGRSQHCRQEHADFFVSRKDQHRECQNDSNHAHYDHVVYILPSFSVRFDESGALCRVPSFPAPPNMSSNLNFSNWQFNSEIPCFYAGITKTYKQLVKKNVNSHFWHKENLDFSIKLLYS